MSLLTKNGKESSTPSEAVDFLLEAHFPEHGEGRDNDHGEKETFNKTDRDVEIVEYITAEKVSAALQSFGNMKTPGPDGFKPIVQLAIQTNWQTG